jgi:dienelactone hydrolase
MKGWLMLLSLVPAIAAQESLWWINDSALFQPPAVTWIDTSALVKELTHETAPLNGTMRKTHAYYGTPRNFSGKLPAILIVPGSGGAAEAERVEEWIGYGYAAMSTNQSEAIAMNSDFSSVDQGKNSWYYHAEATLIRAISFLSSRPEVDTNRIALYGASWGGYHACAMVGIDKRIDVAVTYYGCGYIYEETRFADGTRPDLFVKTVDASNYLPRAAIPMLWVNDPKDKYYYLYSFWKSYRSKPGRDVIRLETGMTHYYEWKAPQVRWFVDAFCFDSAGLPEFTSLAWKPDSISARYETRRAITKAEIVYTTNTNIRWSDPGWQTAAATLDTASRRAFARVPPGSRVFYLNLYGVRDASVPSERANSHALISTEHIDLQYDSASGVRTYDKRDPTPIAQTPQSLSMSPANRAKASMQSIVAIRGGSLSEINTRFGSNNLFYDTRGRLLSRGRSPGAASHDAMSTGGSGVYIVRFHAGKSDEAARP